MASRKTLSVVGKPGLDPTLPNVALTINDKTYHFCYDFNAIATAEEMTGLRLLDSFADVSSIGASKLRALVYATLLKGQPDITIEEAGSLISPRTMNDIVVALVRAWTGSNPEITEDAKVDSTNPPQEQLAQN